MFNTALPKNLTHKSAAPEVSFIEEHFCSMNLGLKLLVSASIFIFR